MWGNSHSRLAWNRFDCTHTSTSDLASPSTCGFSLSSCRLWMGLGTDPMPCSALMHPGHPRLEMGTSSKRLPGPELELPGSPHTPRHLPTATSSQLGGEHQSARWKVAWFSQSSWACLDPSEVLGFYALNFSFFHLQTPFFYPRHQLSHYWSNIFHRSISVSLVLQYFDLFLKSTGRQIVMGRRNRYTTIFFVYTDVKNMGVKAPVQDLNKGEK